MGVSGEAGTRAARQVAVITGPQRERHEDKSRLGRGGRGAGGNGGHDERCKYTAELRAQAGKQTPP